MITDLLDGLTVATGLEIEENDYGGDEQEYIVYDYTDSRGGLFGDDWAQTVETTIQLRVRLHKETDYYELKETIWDYLEEYDFYDLSFDNYCEKEDGDVFRYLIFECSYTEQRGE